LFQCDDTRGCVMQFWPPDDKHMCSKHVQAWNKLIVKQKFCASSWLITEINILRCTVSKTAKKIQRANVLCETGCLFGDIYKIYERNLWIEYRILFLNPYSAWNHAWALIGYVRNDVKCLNIMGPSDRSWRFSLSDVLARHTISWPTGRNCLAVGCNLFTVTFKNVRFWPIV